MRHVRWIGEHNWVRASDVIDGYISYRERSINQIKDLDDLIHWLEYRKTSGDIAARQTYEQEEYWAKLLRDLMCEFLIKDIKFYNLHYFSFKCVKCSKTIYGFLCKNNKDYPVIMIKMCNHIRKRKFDINYYFMCKNDDMINGLICNK